MHLEIHPDYHQHVVVTPTRRVRVGDVDVWLKDETAQTSGSFKYRGALNFSLYSARGTPFVTASTGNHAAGLACASSISGSRVTTVVPNSTPACKADRVQTSGGQVLWHGNDYEDSRKFAIDLAQSVGATYVPSFDDPRIISGHSQLFIEARAAGAANVDTTFVPVGGGGLLASALLSVSGKVVGVELDTSPGMSQSLAAGVVTPVHAECSDSVDGVSAEGLLVRNVGSQTFEVAQACHTELELTLVSKRELIDSMAWCWKHVGIRVEASAAAPVAAMLRVLKELSGSSDCPKSVLCIISGGNIDEKVWNRAVGESLHRHV